MEKTLVLIKPDAFARHHAGDIIKRYESEGFRILAMKLLKMDERLASSTMPSTSAARITMTSSVS